MALSVNILGSGIRDYANALNKLAVKDKDAALDLLEDGLRSKVTPKILRKFMPEMDYFFDSKTGKFTKEGQSEIKRALNKHNLPESATWGDLFSAEKSSELNIKA